MSVPTLNTLWAGWSGGEIATACLRSFLHSQALVSESKQPRSDYVQAGNLGLNFSHCLNVLLLCFNFLGAVLV